MSVSWIMTTKLLKVRMDNTIGRVRQTLNQNHVHHLLVVEQGKLVGILSDRDVLNATTPYNDTRNETTRDEALLHRRVHQIMTRHPIVVPPEVSISEAAAIMLLHGVSCLPVVEESGTILGIVSMRDLLEHFMSRAIQAA